jgi:hypothetical protein
MPNGGPRPDCSHCENVEGDVSRNPHALTCGLHKIKLASPIYAFCSNYFHPVPQDKDWLDQELDRNQLQSDLMYLWIGFYLIDDDGKRKHIFDYVPLVSFNEYDKWTYQQFLDALGELAEKKREAYRAKGYKLE